MKKIRLTERELTNIIKRVINEQPTQATNPSSNEPKPCNTKEMPYYLNKMFKWGDMSTIKFFDDKKIVHVFNQSNEPCVAGYDELKNIF